MSYFGSDLNEATFRLTSAMAYNIVVSTGGGTNFDSFWFDLGIRSKSYNVVFEWKVLRA